MDTAWIEHRPCLVCGRHPTLAIRVRKGDGGFVPLCNRHASEYDGSPDRWGFHLPIEAGKLWLLYDLAHP